MTTKTKPRYYKSLKYRNGKIVSDYDGSPWTVGEWREVSAPTKACEGLNCCENIIDAMGFVNVEVLAEVEIDGVKIISDDKITVQRMRIIRAWKWDKMDSVALASYSAGLVEANFNKQFPDDSRVRDCNAIVRKYLIDPSSVTEDELRSAAWSAAESAWSAAWSAAESAWSAAWSAAESAESAAMSADTSKARNAMKRKIHNWIIKGTKELKAVE
jgi:hypothetical protein